MGDRGRQAPNSKLQVPKKHQVPNTKHQAPNSREAPSSKLEAPSSMRAPRLGAWNWGDVRCLELGVCCLVNRSWAAHNLGCARALQPLDNPLDEQPELAYLRACVETNQRGF